MSRPLFLGFTEDREHPTDTAGRSSVHLAAPQLSGGAEPERLSPPPAAPPPRQPRRRPFTLTEDQRATGMHVIGSPGTGKSKFLEHCIRQDLDEGRGLAVIDPKGELYYNVLRYCASIRHERQIIPLNLSSGAHVIGFNPFTAGQGDAHTLVNRAIAALIKAWGLRDTDETPTLESVLRCVFHAIIEGGFTIAEAEHFLSYDERTIRDYLASHITNPAVLKEWQQVSAGSRHDWREEWRSTRSKLLRFLSARPLLRFLALADSLDLRRVMDEGAVLLVNLQEAEGVLDEMDARVFGSMLVSKCFSVARQRIRPDGEPPQPFYLYCDEFQNFVSPDVPSIVAQGRAMGLSLILAHQYLGQLSTEDARLVEAVMAAVRTRVVFGIESPTDAAALVPSIFRGLIDFHEVKRIDYSVKFWPEYDRDQVRTTGTASGYSHGRAHTDGRSHTEGRGQARGITSGSSFSSGEAFSYPSWPASGLHGTHVMSTGTGTMDASTSVDSDMSADTESSADSESEAWYEATSESVADIPIYRPVPFLEPHEKEWSLEEQKHRLAEALMLQLQRYCWIKPRDALAGPVLVPVLKPYSLPPELLVEYEAEQAIQAGAIAPDEADRQLAERQRLLVDDARAHRERFDADAAAPLHSNEAPCEPISAKPKGTRPFSKPGRKPRSKRALPPEPA